MPLLPQWLNDLHEQLFGILEKINARKPFVSVHQECLALLARHTSELSDHELWESKAPPDQSRFLVADWESGFRSERPDDYDEHFFVANYDYEGTGPIYEHRSFSGEQPPLFIADQRAHFARVFNRMMDFALRGTSPAARNEFGASLAESLRVYLELWDYDVRSVGENAESEAGGAPLQYVTLDQMAVLASRSKKTLERWLSDDKLPPPDIEGGGGKPHEWVWNNVREPLSKHSGKTMPEIFPSLRRQGV